MMQWTDYLSIAFLQAVITLLVWYVAPYTKEKGKNLATREDIEGITDKIESVKTEYAKELEGLKSQLNSKFHAQTVRFEKEFDSYKEIWGSLIEIHAHLRKLHLAIRDRSRQGESFEAERTQFRQVINEFAYTCEKNRPFFSPAVYEELEKFMRTEVVGTPVTYACRNGPSSEETMFVERLLEELLTGPDESVFTKKIEPILEAIRLRIQSF